MATADCMNSDEQKTRDELAEELRAARREISELKAHGGSEVQVASQEKIVTMFKDIDEAVYVVDPETYNILYLNDFAATIWGSGIGKKCYSALQGRDDPCPFCTNEHILGENLGKTHTWEFQNRVNRRWYRCIDRAIRWGDGRDVRFEIAFDISDQKEIENKLSEVKQLQSTILDNAGDMIFLIEADGTTVYLNTAAKEYFDLDEASFGLIPFNFFWCGESNDKVDRELRRVVEERRGAVVDAACDEHYYEMSLVPVVRNDIVALVVCSARNITNHVQTEQELARHRLHLEDLIRERTSELEKANSKLTFEIAERNAAEEALQEEKEKAEAASCAKSEFLANITHELRTPLNGVIGMSSMLLDTELDSSQRKYAETVVNSANGLLTIINEILDFSEMEAGQLELEALDFDLHTMLDEAHKLFASQAQDKGLVYTCTVDPKVPLLLRGDPGRLRQILVNLVDNAIKFTSMGEVSISISAVMENDSHAILSFEVADTGIGIPAEKQQGLFQAFTQADTSTTRRFGGAGLGLAISSQLVSLMGGEINVQSVEGSGSKFWFTTLLGKQSLKRAETEECYMALEGIRILAVESHDKSREVLAAALDSWGCRHNEVEHGKDALHVLREAVQYDDPFEIAIVSMQLAEMNGEELGMLIKNDLTICQTDVVLTTSAGQRGDRKRLEKHGFSAYLRKPIRKVDLHDCLAMLLGRKSRVSEVEDRLLTRYSITEERKRQLRVLVAEDNVVNQRVALKALERLGYRADAVANGAEAVAALAAIPYEMVLMDCQMPEMDGFTASKRIRDAKSDVCNHDIPIIAMTANVHDGDPERCLEAGMNDYVLKPVAPSTLKDIIDKWC